MVNKISIQGQKGKTVCYTMLNLVITEGATLNIKWDAFRFYTPAGGIYDEEEHKYCEIQSFNETISRDTEFDKEIEIYIKKETAQVNIYLTERFLGSQDASPITIEGLEGDMVLWGTVPADPGQEIQIEYKEVTSG